MSSSPTRPGNIARAIDARRRALAELLHSPALNEGHVAEAVRQVTESASACLGVERASVWRLVDGGTAIECVDLYQKTENRHSAGQVIKADDAPRYFHALRQERSICAHDARTDPSTSEFTAGYLEPFGITSMLDAPVFVRGEMVGVVCNEHLGAARTWDFNDELLAGTFADFVAKVIETRDWRRADDALRVERDALESKVAERTARLQESETNLRALLDSSPVAMVLTRIRDNRVAYANRRAAAMFEVPLDQIIGQHSPEYWVIPTDREHFLAGLRANGRVDDLEVHLRSSSGRTFWCRLSAQRLRFDGEDTLLGAMIDISDERAAREHLQDLAMHDGLTGLYNRRRMEEVIGHEIERAQRYGHPLAVAVLDVDRFKSVNDLHGHPAGDDVIRTVAARSKMNLRATDVIGRFGGDEFVIVLPETALADARVVAERVRESVGSHAVQVLDREIDVSVSIGIAAFDPTMTAASFLARADEALYAAKQAGRNRVVPG